MDLKEKYLTGNKIEERVCNMKIKQFINDILYGKYYLNRENAEYLNEHNIYFRKMLEHEIAYITGFCFEYEHKQSKLLKPTKTFLGFPKFKNILKNEQIIKSTNNRLEPLMQQKSDLEYILSKPLSEINAEDINSVYEIRYKRRKNELEWFSLRIFACIAILIIIKFLT